MSLSRYPLVSDWIEIRDGRVCVRTGKVDIGQRISTALRQIVAEELGLNPADIDVAPVRTDISPDEGITSGSNSIEQSGRAVRLAAATLRRELADLAAEQLQKQKTELRFVDGYICPVSGGQRLSVPDLLKCLPQLVPVDLSVTFAHVSNVSRSGRPDMGGLHDMVTGAFRFVHDIEVPGMVHACNVRPPHSRATLNGIDDRTRESLAKAGITVIRDGSYVAVAGADEWQVLQASRKLSGVLSWDTRGGLPETDVFSRLQRKHAVRLAVRDGVPQPDQPVPDPLTHVNHSARKSARYERPYQMHGALAPAAAFAVWQDNRLEITCHSQGVYPLRDTIAETLGLLVGNVIITHMPGSGCYGHNGADDAAFEAALIAMQLPGTPVLLKWTREEEHRWEPYAPAMAVEIDASLSPKGLIAAYSAEVFSDTHRGRPRPGANGAGPARLLTNRFRAAPLAPYSGEPNLARHAGMHRNLDPIYAFATKRLVKNLIPGGPLRSSAMRGLGAVANIFALESFLDEIRVTVEQDPIAYRLAHLNDPRSRAVLERLRSVISDRPLSGPNTGRGIAFAQYKNAMTRAAVGVDIRVADDACVTVASIVIVADPGRIIDRDGVIAQLEGGAVQAASWALKEEVLWDREGIQTRDWQSYPVFRFDEVPEIVVDLIEHPDAPSVGVGEASPGPTVAAIANAIYDAVGVRVRRMPFTAATIRKAAAE